MANWELIYEGASEIETDNGREATNIKAHVLIEDGRPARVNVSAANYAGNEVEEAVAAAYPGKKIVWIGIPSGEDELVGMILADPTSTAVNQEEKHDNHTKRT